MSNNKKSNAHRFTLKGKRITGFKLAKKLKCTTSTLYEKANKCGSDRGEDIAKILKMKRKCQKTRVMWNGMETLVSEIAIEIGVAKHTLFNRLRLYGEDCCFTYFPGRIPKGLRVKDIKPNVTNRGSREFRKLGARPRNKNLCKIRPLGTWEARQ